MYLTHGVGKMKKLRARTSVKILLVFSLLLFLPAERGDLIGEESAASLRSLLPEVESWNFAETPQHYFPETLYEYIDGAAEIYIGYDFKQLIVGQYKKDDSEASLSVEIYDMGHEKNSFGIYSAERFPDSRFISIGNQGYLEEGTLNFIVGSYYVKLLFFDGREESESLLRQFSLEIVKEVKEKGQLPSLLEVFPQHGLIPYSEKYILHNFMGYHFFHDGYLADFKQGDLEFECFLIEGKEAAEAQSMLEQFLAVKGKENVEKIPSGYHLKDRYYGYIYLSRVKNCLCGVMKITDGFEETGEEYLRNLIQSLKRHQLEAR